MELYSDIWTVVESLGFVLIVVIFFLDPIRRWNFFGYRPTAVMGLYDSDLGKILLSKVNKAWSFNQGGMYGNNIYFTVNNILRRELGLPETRFKLVYTKPLGAVRIDSKQLLNRARISTISIFRRLRGKGYLGCFIRIDLSNVESEIQRGAGVKETRIVDYEEARKLVRMYMTEEHNPKKQQLIVELVDEIERFASEIRKWENDDSEEPDDEKTAKSELLDE